MPSWRTLFSLGRPSIDPVLMIRMLIVGYAFDAAVVLTLYTSTYSLILAERGLGNLGCSKSWKPLIDDVVAAVDIERLARDQAGGVVSEESGGHADILDADKTAGRGLCLGFVK